MRLDSVVVLPQCSGVSLDDVWSEATAERIATLLAQDESLRVIPAERAQSYSGEARGAEEIGRELNVRAAALCRARISRPALDLHLELVDVLAEATIAEQTFLSSTADARRLQLQAARVLAEWLTQKRRPIHDNRHSLADEECLLHIRGLARDGRIAEALTACRQVPVDLADSDLLVEVVRVTADAPSRFLDRHDVERAKDALARVTSDLGHAVRAKIACRFDFQWQLADREFESACEGRHSTSVDADYALFLIAMRRFSDASLRIRWITGPRRLQFERLMTTLFQGDAAEAVAALRACAGGAADDPYRHAQDRALAGKHSSALEAVARSIDERSPMGMFAAVDPAFESLRSGRRFQKLMRMVDLA